MTMKMLNQNGNRHGAMDRPSCLNFINRFTYPSTPAARAVAAAENLLHYTLFAMATHG
jgi:hypothetical protein